MPFRRVRIFIKLRKIKEQAGFMLMRRMCMRKRRGEGDGTLHYCPKERELGKEIRHYWDSAWTLHVEGFHEAT